jgi:hypothetical protein
VEGDEEDKKKKRAQRLHLLGSSWNQPGAPTTRDYDEESHQVHIQVQNKVGTYEPYKALFTTK